MEEKKFFRVWGTPADEKINFELFLINQGNVDRVNLWCFLTLRVRSYRKTYREQVVKSLFRWKRGPNMAFRDLGKSRYTPNNFFVLHFHALVLLGLR